jgi:putative toxin-antitoxin system antitoxin component (TIGR02293 family)
MAYTIMPYGNIGEDMTTAKTKNVRFRPGLAARGRGIPGFKGADPIQTARAVKLGFPYARLAEFQRATQLSWESVSGLVGIPKRTLARRQSEGKLQPDESDRLYRAWALFEKAVDLFEGDVAAANRWLQTPQEVLGNQTPLELASTDVGAREVENLILRLEQGVFS